MSDYRLKCTKFNFGGGAYSAPSDPLAGFQEFTSKEEEKDGNGKEKGMGEGKGRRRGRERTGKSEGAWNGRVWGKVQRGGERKEGGTGRRHPVVLVLI